MVALVACGVLAVAVVAIAATVVFHRFENGWTSAIAFTVAAASVAVGVLAALSMAPPD